MSDPSPAEHADALTPEMIDASRRLRLTMLDDPYRPTYHFVTPEGFCGPFDPNGAIFWKGRYHLGYIYQDGGVHLWGHASSLDLLHWRHHRPWVVVTDDSPETGIFSGNCFVNKAGEATMLYHGCGQGNCICTSADPQLDTFKKLPANPITPCPAEGSEEEKLYRSWDPHGWLEGDTYYAIYGGNRPAIFKATELDKWQYVGDLLHHAYEGVDINEDISCPDLFELGGKHVLICISHRLGCRYYVGEWKGEQFHPEYHQQMSWVDNAYFAPETLLDGSGRRILWAWIFDGREPDARAASGWSGTMGLPRELSLRDDLTLGQRPVAELKRLRYHEQPLGAMTVQAGSARVLEGVAGNTFELEIVMAAGKAAQCGVCVCCSPGGQEQTLVYYDAAAKKLVVDATKSSLTQGPRNVEAGPFELADGENLTLRVFVDKSVVEVFANDRQAVMRRIYPSRPDSVGVSIFAESADANVKSATAWEMMPANPY